MPDNVSPEIRRKTMAAVKPANTGPEMAVRRAVHKSGFRYRLHVASLPGKPDLVFPRFKLAVFVHGCFWHWHGCTRSRMPKENRDYWERKISRNRARDRQMQEQLQQLGWRIEVIWECGINDGITQLLRELDRLRASYSSSPANSSSFSDPTVSA